MTETNKSELGARLDWQAIEFKETPKLGENELHVWCIPLILDESKIKVAESQLNPIQLDKYKRRTANSNQHAYLAGRYYLHQLLSTYTNSTPDQFSLSYSRLNKPSLEPNPKNLQFNFTDTKFDDITLGVYVFALNKSVGVDIEHLQRRSNFEKIYSKRFSQAEQQYALAEKNQICPEKVLAVWTRKEAFGKACGVGINFPMATLCLLTDKLHQTSFESIIEPFQRFQLQQFYINQSHIAAAVYEGDQSLDIKAFNLANHKP